MLRKVSLLRNRKTFENIAFWIIICLFGVLLLSSYLFWLPLQKDYY